MALITNSALSKPAVTSTGQGRFVVVWEDNSIGIPLKARFITAAGEADGPEFQMNTTPGASRAAAMQRRDLADPEFAVAWNRESTRQVLMQRFRGDGAKVGSEIVVSSMEVEVKYTPVIAKLSNRIVVAWTTFGEGREGLRASFF